MSRTGIELWISNKRADLSDASFILMTWTQEDLGNPSVVKNSFSKQITLPGTPANNDIFGGIFRNDRVTQYAQAEQTGRFFDPTRKTDFRIYNALGEVVESGYLRLNTVTRKGDHVVEYKVTLYGGLGSFLYGLSYDDAGEKRTLAGLNFIGSNDSDGEFDFTLNATSVRAAWTRIAEAADALSTMWDYINFAPCYNGLPGGTFDANKGVLDVVEAGLSDGAGTVDGQAIVALTKEYTEWDTRDLRSYLQRPVVRLRALIEAIADPDNNGGWTVNLDPDFFDSDNPYWNKTWMTLPVINTDNLVESESGSGDLDFVEITEDGPQEAYVEDSEPERDYALTVALYPQISMPDVAAGTKYMHCESGGYVWMTVMEYTLQAFDENDSFIDSKKVRLCSRQFPDGADYPPIDFIGTFTKGAATIASWNGPAVSMTLNAMGAYRVVLSVSLGKYKFDPNQPSITGDLFSDPLDTGSAFSVGTVYLTGTGSYLWSDIAGGRSGRPCTKAAILSGGGTPADYLLAFCKMFGMVLVADSVAKTVDIMPRAVFYSGGSTVDLDGFVDTDSVTKEPFAFSARWYVWDAGYDSGEWAKTYKEKYGKSFGQMRVDTGYSFDANTTQVMGGSALKGAVMALENSKYNCLLGENGHELPSVLLDRGAKYTRRKSETENEDVDIEAPGAYPNLTWLNSAYPTYDMFPKAQLHDAEQKAFGGEGVLLFFTGMADVSGCGYVVTDDTPYMISQNGGTPCWLLDWGNRVPAARISYLPAFSRYLETDVQHQGFIFAKSLDYGTPTEVPIPDASFVYGGSVYDGWWRAYIADRYDDDSAVLRCKVNLRALRVGAGLLRNFYRFDGAVWALNKINNHSITTDDLTECEFVKVQDTDNYTE